MSDGGMKVVVHTQELEASDKAELMNSHNKVGYFVFSITGIKEEDIPDQGKSKVLGAHASSVPRSDSTINFREK